MKVNKTREKIFSVIAILVIIILILPVFSSHAFSQAPILMEGWPYLFHDTASFSAPLQGITLYDISIVKNMMLMK